MNSTIEELEKKEKAIEEAISKAVPVYTKKGIKLEDKVFLMHRH